MSVISVGCKHANAFRWFWCLKLSSFMQREKKMPLYAGWYSSGDFVEDTDKLLVDQKKYIAKTPDEAYKRAEACTTAENGAVRTTEQFSH